MLSQQSKEHMSIVYTCNVFCNALAHVIYSGISGQFSLYSVVITRYSNPPISQFSSPCNEFTIVWSMFVYNIHTEVIQQC